MDPIEICANTIKEEFPDLAGIWLFGSAVAGLDNSSSDIDLAVLPTQSPGRVKLWQCAQSVAGKVDRDVDLIDLLDASTVLRAQIVQHGRRIYCADKLACEMFETEALADYLRFADERKELMEDIKLRGKVSGQNG